MIANRYSQAIPPLAVPALAALIMYGVVLFLPTVLNDADTFWHIATGEKMLQLHHVLHTDPFSHTVPGREWQTHEWLSEILMALFYRMAGWSGIVILGGLGAAAMTFILGAWVSRFLPPLSTAVALFLSMSALMPSLLVRPHLIALPLLALWTAMLLLARERHRSPPLWLPAVMVVWANMHGGYVFGLAMIGPFALEALIAAPRERWLHVIRTWGLFGVLALLAALVTPHGVEGLIFPFKVMTMKTLDNIVEWKPVSFGKPSGLELAMMATLLACLGHGVRVGWVRLGVLLGLFHMALRHIRHAIVLAVVSPMLLAEPLGRAIEPAMKPDLRRRWLPVVLIALVELAGVTAARLTVPLERRNDEVAPMRALATVPQQVRATPVLNSYGLGGFLIFSGVKVFMDGRADMYGDAYTSEYLKIEHGDVAAMDKAIARYKIQWMFLNTKSGAARVMTHKAGWKQLYRDKATAVYVREGSGRSTSLPPSTTR